MFYLSIKKNHILDSVSLSTEYRFGQWVLGNEKINKQISRELFFQVILLYLQWQSTQLFDFLPEASTKPQFKTSNAVFWFYFQIVSTDVTEESNIKRNLKSKI
jgi:hypothetical protein